MIKYNRDRAYVIRKKEEMKAKKEEKKRRKRENRIYITKGC
jgi:hypothetical protein